MLPTVVWRRTPAQAMLIIAAMLCMVHPAAAQVGRKLGFQELVDKADQIFVGDCVEKKCLIRNSTIITRYVVRPSELIKGKLDSSLSGDVVIEEPGGEAEKVPVGVMAPGTARMNAGEQVLLFTEKPDTTSVAGKARAARAAALKAKNKNYKTTFDDNAMRIVGLSQGYYTVVTNPENGVKMVTPGGTVEFQRSKSVLQDNRTTASARRLRSRLMSRLKTAQAEVNAAAREKKIPAIPEELTAFSALDDVKTQISNAMKNSQ